MTIPIATRRRSTLGVVFVLAGLPTL
ncbi:MAG: hypothetical protein QOK27_2196, partial [Gemmatimonadales bacterium]|nr:hypothetical protein [Gemmatimonadales bacterium]